MPDEKGKELLDRAFEGLERETPDTITHRHRWVRDPKSRWIRLPLGILCIIELLLVSPDRRPRVLSDRTPVDRGGCAIPAPARSTDDALARREVVRLRRRYREWKRARH